METKTIELKPNYSAIFRFAIHIVRAEIAKDSGQELVVEMLEYGKRLHEAREEE